MAHALLKAKALPSGGHLAIVSPASTPKAERVEAGAAALGGLGYRTTVFPHALDRGPLYYAGTVEDRLRDLHAAFADPEVDGIVCTRGGWGSAELLPGLDIQLIRANPKPFVGYSDHTSLHTYLLEEAGLVTFYGPMVAADFARPGGADLASWNHALTGSVGWSLGAGEGLRTLRAGPAVWGQLRGGCLSIYTESLGTAYAPGRAEGPVILFLEDIGVKPFQWDRFLVHLRYAGGLEGVVGIVFGDMSANVGAGEERFLEEALLHSLRDFAGPIAIGLRSGHVDAPNVTLPLGVQVELACAEDARLTVSEAGVAASSFRG